MIIRSKILEVIYSYLNVPYLDRGNTKEKGIDCAHLPILVAKEFGVVIPEGNNYSLYPEGQNLKDRMSLYLNRIERKDAQVGDIILFSSAGLPAHLAMISRVEPIYIVHAVNSSQYAVREELFELSKWDSSRVDSFYRFKDIIEE